jgi:hypothetical protein
MIYKTKYFQELKLYNSLDFSIKNINNINIINKI